MTQLRLAGGWQRDSAAFFVAFLETPYQDIENELKLQLDQLH